MFIDILTKSKESKVYFITGKKLQKEIISQLVFFYFYVTYPL